MNYKAIEGQKQYCAFGFFDMEGNLLGYRMDMSNTMGTNYAKIYPYSESQVKIVMKQINQFVTDDTSYDVELLKMCGYSGKPVVAQANKHRNERRGLRDCKEFEVRVLPAPEHEPFEPVDLEMWLLQAPSLEPLETHKFKL